MLLNKLRQFWFEPIDRRVYALVQFFYAFAALCNIVQIFPDRYRLLSEDGFFSNSPWLFQNPISLFHFFDSNTAVDIFLLAAILACLALMLNFLPRAAAIFLFFWHLSLISRLGPSFSGWDLLLTHLGLLVSISPMRGQRVPTYGLRLIQLQVTLLYWGSLIFKLRSDLWLNGGAIAYFLNSDYVLFPTRIGIEIPILSVFLTYLTLAIEMSAPILLWSKKTRPFGFAAGYALHIILLFTVIPVFSISVMTAYLAFLTGDDLDRLPVDRLSVKIKKLSRGFWRRFAYDAK